jgi:5-formyltetrahydrofolate cyclo-ligase
MRFKDNAQQGMKMQEWNDIRAWRKMQREALVARRAALEREQRHQWNEHITELLWHGFPVTAGMVVGFCWPFKGEFDPRFVIRRWRERGVTAALPEVVAKGQPLQFRKWWPGAPMTPGVYDIPVPAGTDILLPDVAIVPMNGFDESGYRLGYGGGYFDRTLAALDRRVLAIGVSFEMLRLPTIFPQSHDIPMDFVVTEDRVYRAGGEKLVPLDAAACATEAMRLMESRVLPRRAFAATAMAAHTSGGYSSPPCYAHEVAPGYFGEATTMPAAELLALLDVLLEAERAGAKVIAAFLDDYERDTPAWRQLAAVQRDEAKNCAILIDLIRRSNGAPSAAIGDFLEKALAVQGRVARLRFLNRGQNWVARKIREALPQIGDDSVRGALSAMLESHLLNIEACDALMETLEA